MTEAEVVGAVTERLESGEPVQLRLWGRSMLPVVWPGALLRFLPSDGTDARRGDVVLARRGGCLVAHRVVRVVPGGLVTRGDGLSTEERLAVPGDVRGIAVGVPLGATQLPLRAALARPTNVLLGGAARLYHASGGQLGKVANGIWNAARRVPLVDQARRALQPYRIEPLAGDCAGRIDEILLRSNRRPTSRALFRWSRAANGDGKAWLALRNDACVGWLLASSRDASEALELELWVARGSRGISIASSLVTSMLETAVARGWSRLEIRARPATAAWLVRRGFREIGSAGAESDMVILEWTAGTN